MKLVLPSTSILILLAFCIGCGLRPGKSQLREAPYSALAIAQNQSASSDSTTVTEWPKEDWWRIFGDEQLNTLICKAISSNPQMTIAKARVQIAGAQFRKERAPLFPDFNGSGDYTRIRASKNGIFGLLPGFPLSYTQPELMLNFNYEFDFWKKHTNLINAAIDEVEARAAEAYLTRLILAVSVADTYFQLQTSHLRLEIANELIQIRKKNVELTLLRRQHALDNDWDVNRAKTAQLVAYQFYEEVFEDLTTNKNELQAYLAEDFSTEVVPVDISIGLTEPFPIPETLPIDLLCHRADVWAARWRVEAAARQICVARANFYPNINLVGFIGLQTIFPSKLFDSNSVFGSIGPAFHLPIFDGGLLSAEYDARIQEYRMSVAEYDQIVLDAVKEVLNALAILTSTHELYLIAKAGEQVAKDSFDLAQKRLANQLNSRLDVLNYENDWLQSRDIYLRSLLGSLEARLELFRALGGGYGYCCEE